MREVRVHDGFVPAGSPAGAAGVPTITVGAGTRWLEAYQAVLPYGRYVPCTTPAPRAFMPLVADVDLPLFGCTAPDFTADSYHAELVTVHSAGWLLRCPIAGEPELGGVEGIYGIECLTHRWTPGSRLP
jgi:hypothetical protein